MSTEKLTFSSFMFSAEEHFQSMSTQQWMVRQMPAIYLMAVAYVLVVHGGQVCMRRRRPFCLRVPLALWNFGLGAFSVMAMVRMLPDTLGLWRLRGFSMLSCEVTANTYTDLPVANFWTFLFCMSKIVELGDTAFLVLRKRPLLFLHWVHHAVTLVACWYLVSNRFPLGRCFVAMNVVVHAFMYNYFWLRSINVAVPISCAKALTLLQTTQMFCGFFLSSYVLALVLLGYPCEAPFDCCLVSMAMYGSYVVLFLKFYIDTYLKQKRRRASQLQHAKAT